MKETAEEMDVKKTLIIVLLIATIVGIIVIVKRQLDLESEVKSISKDKRNLLQFQIEQSQKPDKLKASIINLMAYFNEKDSEVFGELKDALDSLKHGKEAEAARAIVVSVETTLKKMAEKDHNEWFISFKKPEKIGLWNLIEKFKSTGVFNEEDFQLASICAPFRNKKSHKAGIEHTTPYNVKMLHVHAGIILLTRCVEAQQQTAA